MPGSITHAYVATGTDAGNGEVHKSQWNAGHTLIGVPYTLAQSGAAVSVGAVTTEAVLATITVPAGAMGPNGWIQVISTITCTSNANNKQHIIRLGGAAGTIVNNAFFTTSTGNTRITAIANQNSNSAQITLAPSGNTPGIPGTYSAAYPTAAVNTSSAWDLVIAGQKAVAGDTLTLEAYQVLICYGA